MAGTALEWRKGVSEDLVGGDFSQRHTRKAVSKQAEDSFWASRNGTEVSLLVGFAAVEQRHSSDVGGITIAEVIHGR